MATMRAMGVEEELLLVDSATGVPMPAAAAVLRAAAGRGAREPAPATEKGGSVRHEVHQAQIETDTPPEVDVRRLEADLRAWRALARASALESGVRLLATGTSPLDGAGSLVRKPRYDAMAQLYAGVLADHLVCGCHVHVDVASPEEGVGVLDRIRVWLPVLLALSANSPWTRGRDSGFQSYRAQMIARWPSSGPTPVFGSLAAYRRHVQAMLGTEVVLDEAMVYYEARLSARHPTVEIRAADVCLDVRDTVLVAALSRALVETAARAWVDGVPPPGTPGAETSTLRLATWQASRYGLTGALLDPASGRPRPAPAVLEDLLAYTDAALTEAGDTALVHAGVRRVLASGTGAARQRALLSGSGGVVEAISRLCRLTVDED